MIPNSDNKILQTKIDKTIFDKMMDHRLLN